MTRRETTGERQSKNSAKLNPARASTRNVSGERRALSSNYDSSAFEKLAAGFIGHSTTQQVTRRKVTHAANKNANGRNMVLDMKKKNCTKNFVRTDRVPLIKRRQLRSTSTRQTDFARVPSNTTKNLVGNVSPIACACQRTECGGDDRRSNRSYVSRRTRSRSPSDLLIQRVGFRVEEALIPCCPSMPVQDQTPSCQLDSHRSSSRTSYTQGVRPRSPGTSSCACSVTSTRR